MREYVEGYMDDDETRRYIALRLAIDSTSKHEYDRRYLLASARDFEAYLKGAKTEEDF